MCGICGIVEFDPARPADAVALKAMTDSMILRGPDGEGFFFDGPAGIGARRLAIIDIPGGAQPMQNEDGSVAVAFNGEIYNHAELREELKKKGHVFRSRCDTEVLAHLYEQHGPDMVGLLNGMFAFAVWDQKERTLFVARDRLGIKPLYFCRTGRGFAFASEIKSLLQAPGVEVGLDHEALHHFLTLRFTPGPRTLFSGIRKLAAGHSLTVKDGRVTVRRYWDLPGGPPEPGIGAARAAERVRELVEDSVRLRLIADVPLGMMLSGGLDSTAVLCAAANAGASSLSSFTLEYEEPGEHNEAEYARMAAEAFGARYHPVPVGLSDFADGLSAIVRLLEEPVADMSSYPILRLCEQCRKTVTVLLCGMGGDEVFGGYGVYREAVYGRWAGMVPGPVWDRLVAPAFAGLPARVPGKNFVKRVRRPVEETYLGANFVYGGFSEEEKSGLYREELRERQERFDTRALCRRLMENVQGRSALSKMIYLDTKLWLCDSHLIMGDKMSMAASVEMRIPLLDHRLVEAAWQMPDACKVTLSDSKAVLKKAFKREIPEPIRRRPKRGFSVPVDLWFKDPDSRLSQMLRDPGSPLRGLFRQEPVDRLFDLHRRGAGDYSAHLFTLLTLDLWMRNFLHT
ncbi:MAG: asparagine synthase (glutamine-hydrolyzing) [Thermodesulfobacteriota bacterium]